MPMRQHELVPGETGAGVHLGPGNGRHCGGGAPTLSSAVWGGGGCYRSVPGRRVLAHVASLTVGGSLSPKGQTPLHLHGWSGLNRFCAPFGQVGWGRGRKETWMIRDARGSSSSFPHSGATMPVPLLKRGPENRLSRRTLGGGGLAQGLGI